MCSVADEDEEGGLEAELAAEKAADPMNELVAGMAAEKAELAADPMNELAEIQEDTVAEAEVEKGAQASTLAKEVVDTQEHWKEPAKRPGPGDYETGQSTLSVRGGVIGRAPRFGADKDGKEGTGAGSGANRRCESSPRSPPDRPTDATRFVDADHTGASKTTNRGAGGAGGTHTTLDDLRHGDGALQFMVPAVDPDPQHQTIFSRFPRFIPVRPQSGNHRR
jgi:hypothetical protein